MSSSSRHQKTYHGQREWREAVASYAGDVGCHLIQIGEAVSAYKFTVFDFELLGCFGAFIVITGRSTCPLEVGFGDCVESLFYRILRRLAGVGQSRAQLAPRDLLLRIGGIGLGGRVHLLGLCMGFVTTSSHFVPALNFQLYDFVE